MLSLTMGIDEKNAKVGVGEEGSKWIISVFICLKQLFP